MADLVFAPAATSGTPINDDGLIFEPIPQPPEIPPDPTGEEWRGPPGEMGPPGVQGDPGKDGIDGSPGPPGPSAVSADAGNSATLGSDSLIYVPAAESGATLTVADTPPTLSQGALWFDSISTSLFVGYVDPSGPPGQWVVANNTGMSGSYLPLTGGTVSGLTSFTAGLGFSGGSNVNGSLTSQANWGALLRGNPGAVADVGLQSTDGNVPVRVTNGNTVQFGYMRNMGATQTISGSGVLTRLADFSYNLAGSSTTSTRSYGFNFGVVSDTLAQPGATHSVMRVLEQPAAGWQGSRIGLDVAMQVSGATDLTSSVAAGNGSVTAISGISTSAYNQGGVASGYGSTQFGVGVQWGAVIQSTLQTGATYYNGNCIMELDSTAPATTQLIENVGLQIVQYPINAAQGQVRDVGLTVGGSVATKNWRTAIGIGSNVYGWGLDPNGYGVRFERGPNGTVAPVAAGGIDLSQVDFTGSGAFGGGFAYRSQNVQILNDGSFQIGAGALSSTTSALSIDVGWQQVASATIASGGINHTANDVLYGQNGSIFRVTAVSAGVVTGVALVRGGWSRVGALPANPVAFTCWGRVGSSLGSGCTLNLTWSSAPNAIGIGNAGSTTTLAGTVVLPSGTTGPFLPTGGGTVTGATTFSAAGTALTVTNNATISGTLSVTGSANVTQNISVGAGNALYLLGTTAGTSSNLIGRWDGVNTFNMHGDGNWGCILQGLSGAQADVAIMNRSALQIRLPSTGGVRIEGTIGFNATNPIAKPTVTGSRGGNAALASLLTALASYGLITDSSTA